MEHIVAKKTDETRRRWEVAIKDKNFDCIRNLAVAETRAEHFDRALAEANSQFGVSPFSAGDSLRCFSGKRSGQTQPVGSALKSGVWAKWVGRGRGCCSFAFREEPRRENEFL